MLKLQETMFKIVQIILFAQCHAKNFIYFFFIMNLLNLLKHENRLRILSLKLRINSFKFAKYG